MGKIVLSIVMISSVLAFYFITSTLVDAERLNSPRIEKRGGEISKIPKPAYSGPYIESVCLDGVKYYILEYNRVINITPALMRNGRPVPCGDDILNHEENQ